MTRNAALIYVRISRDDPEREKIRRRYSSTPAAQYRSWPA